MSYFIQSLPNFNIYLTWDKRSTKTAIQYDILYSEYFDGTYTLLDSVDYPVNEYIHEKYSYEIEKVIPFHIFLFSPKPVSFRTGAKKF